MDNQTNAIPVAVLAGYLEGRKDGFVAGVVVAMGGLILWKAYRRDREGFTNRLVGRNHK